MRKNRVLPYKLISSGDMSGSLTSTTLLTGYLDNIGIIASWVGTSPVGAITVEVRNNYNDVTSPWVTLDFGTPISVSGNTGSAAINVNQSPFDELRVVFTRSSGIGAMDVVASAKTVGA